MTIDVQQPPAGVRLQLASVAAKYHVSVSDIADAAGVSRTAAFNLLSNDWPKRLTDDARHSIRLAIDTLLRARGATPDEAELAWHARCTGTTQAALKDHSTDYYGRDPNAPRRGQPFQPTTHPEEPEMLLSKQALSPQARRHFKLFTNPFDGEVTSDAQMFDGADVRYVREAAWQCSQVGGFVAIVGESGAGKTTIQTDLEARLQVEGRNVITIKPSVLGMEESNAKGQMLKSTDILHAIITTLQPEAVVPQTLQARTVKAGRMLTASAEAGAVHLLVIEEAHGLPDATLKHLKRLHEMRLGRRPLLGILLIAQPELKLRLANGLRTGALREVAQRCEVVELLPLDGDLRAYLECRASAAGHKLDDLMEPKAVDELRVRLTRKTQGGAVSMCYPLAVNNMVTKALNKAAELGLPVVSADLVKQV